MSNTGAYPGRDAGSDGAPRRPDEGVFLYPELRLNSQACEDRVGAWLESVLEMAWLGRPEDVAAFVERTIDPQDPPDLGGRVDRSTAGLLIKALVLNAETHASASYTDAVDRLIGAGVVRRNDMSAVEVTRFLTEHRGADGRANFQNGALKAMVRAGVTVGRAGPNFATENPRGASELLNICADVIADRSDYATSLRTVLECVSRGMNVDLNTLFAPGYSGCELLIQARRLKEQFTGEPAFL